MLSVALPLLACRGVKTSGRPDHRRQRRELGSRLGLFWMVPGLSSCSVTILNKLQPRRAAVPLRLLPDAEQQGQDTPFEDEAER